MSVMEPEVIAGSVAEATNSGMSALSMFFVLLLPAIVLYYIYFRIANKHMIEVAEKIPGPPAYPIIGNALEFLGSPDGKENIFNKNNTHVRLYARARARLCACMRSWPIRFKIDDRLGINFFYRRTFYSDI